MLQLQGVSKRYGDKVVVHPLDLKLEAEKTYVLLGPSGCGKSTLLRLMIGLIPPDSGVALLNGQQLTQENTLELRRTVGYVIQDGGLFPHLTAAENTGLVAKFLRWQRPRIEQRVKELSELSHFPTDALTRYPTQLSGGQRQRVGLMRALMLDPALLLLDEPLGALDPLVRFDLQNDLRHIFRSLRKSVIIVTHDLHEAAFFADEVILLRDGRIMQRGTVDQLVTAPADPFVTQFINAQRSSFTGAN
jgi:osmoprotectant transport system ATP-binding protein